MDDIFYDIKLQDCPFCGGAGRFEEEGGWCLYIQCPDCGSHTAEFQFSSGEERLEMAERAARVWNMGKIIQPLPGD